MDDNATPTPDDLPAILVTFHDGVRLLMEAALGIEAMLVANGFGPEMGRLAKEVYLRKLIELHLAGMVPS